VTRFTKSHEIAIFIATTFREREDVVDFLGWCQLTLLEALLAERVCFDETITDTLPSTTVSFV